MNEAQLSRDFMDVIPRSMAAIRSEMRGQARSRFSVVQFRVLANIWARREDAITNRELAELIGVTVPCMSRVVDGLARKGMVARRVDKTDRRRVNLRLTPRGEAAFATLHEDSSRRISGRFSSLSEHQRELLAQGLSILKEVFN